MKKYLICLPIMVLCSCEWIITQPNEEKEIIKSMQEASMGLYHYDFSEELGPQLEPKAPPAPMPPLQ